MLWHVIQSLDQSDTWPLKKKTFAFLLPLADEVFSNPYTE